MHFQWRQHYRNHIPWLWRYFWGPKNYWYRDEQTTFGLLFLIFWTFILVPLLKYVNIVLRTDDNGEGGPIALYLLLCRHAKIPNQQAPDEVYLHTTEMGHLGYQIRLPPSGFCLNYLQNSFLMNWRLST